jgi:L-seryl-tRNA(Ser) seleniumtransferase
MTTIFEELGVRPVINAQGNRTLLGGGTPSPEIRALMDAAEDYYVNMSELMDAVGVRIADMLDVDAALVTSGCSAALAYAAAACMTGDDVDRIERIPDTQDMPNEIIIQRQLRVKYDRCMTIPGGRLVEIGSEEHTTVEDLEAAIGSQTAAIHYLAPGDRSPGALPLETVIEVGHANGIPIIVDAAGQVYPTDLLSRYVKMGADLVAYGAKYFGSVNSSGLLTGTGELVNIARSHSFVGFEASPIRSFGRPMKVDRQEVVAVFGALRAWLTMNHEDRFAAYEARVSTLRSGLTGISGVSLEYLADDGPVEGLTVVVDPDTVGMTGADVVEELRGGNPSIWVREFDSGDRFAIRLLTLSEGAEEIIIDRLRQILG